MGVILENHPGDASKFVIKDSGQRIEHPSGMKRDIQAGKPRYDLCYDGPLFARWATHLAGGAEKYGVRNWMKADSQEELERFIDSACRHLAQWVSGDTTEDHAAAVVFNLNGAEYVKEKLKARAAKEAARRQLIDVGKI